MRRTKNILGIKTEASYRFERWVDPDGVVGALNRFAELYSQITGKPASAGIADSYPGRKDAATLSVRLDRVHRLLGVEVAAADCLHCLERLGFQPQIEGERITCIVPSWRADVLREEDLIEEIGRVYGYDKIPELPPHGYASAGGAHGIELFGDQARSALLRCGLDQVMTHTLRGEGPLDRPGDKVRVRTPHSPETAWLRNSTLPGLADCAHRNGSRNLQIFEIGRVFAPGKETVQLGVFMTGAIDAPGWGGSKQTTDFFTLKGVIETLLHTLHVPLELEATSDERFHPTRQAGMSGAGVFGQIHPNVQEALGFADPVFAAEIDLEALMAREGEAHQLRPISRQPAIRRDVAILTSKQTPFADLEKAILGAGGAVLEKHWLFDVYEGKGVPEGSHSLAIALQLRKLDGTFTDEEANQVRDRIVAALTAMGATLR